MTTGVTADGESETAGQLAVAACEGFKAHDEGDRRAALDAFTTVDRRQFAHLSEQEAADAARAYVDALFRKDDVELAALRDGRMEQSTVADADWSPVAAKFRERAAIVGMDPAYATASTEAWRRHKAGGDYWTPIQRAQMHELRAAMDDPAYPHKDRGGQSGFGPEPARYALAVELHDMHTPEHHSQTVTVMRPYFERVLTAHDDGGTTDE